MDNNVCKRGDCAIVKVLMLKQKQKSRLSLRSLLGTLLITTSLVGATTYSAFVGLAAADSYDAQIQSLQDQNSAAQANSAQLGAQAASYQDEVNKLDSQINSLQQSIVSSQQKSDQLQQQIDANQIQLDHQKEVLGENIKAMYLEGQVSTLEILASSNNLSDFVNKEVDRGVVQNKVKSTVDSITALKVKLQQQQQQLQSVIADLQKQRDQLAASESQQSALLAYTEGQKAAYDQQISSNNSSIASLRAAQAAANRSLGGVPVSGDPGHGGYPSYWDYPVGQDTVLDNWGMWNRECVSYTAWKVYQTFGYMPYWGGVGNANQWPGDARAAGIATGSTPRAHSVAISMGGAYGHAMWVEGVSGNTIYVSQYNYNLNGRYSEMSINGSGLIYIYFGG